MGKSPLGTEAPSVNTLDEVIDGDWFVNRHGSKRMSIEDLVRGPNQGEPPNPDGNVDGLPEQEPGHHPGVRDQGRVGRLATSSSSIRSKCPSSRRRRRSSRTKIFYALGYHVPENYIVRVHPDRFAIEPGTQIEDSFGDKSELTPFRFRRIIRRIPRLRRRHDAGHRERVRRRDSHRTSPVFRDPERRPERRHPPRGPARAARTAPLRRLAQPRRHPRSEHPWTAGWRRTESTTCGTISSISGPRSEAAPSTCSSLI